MIRRVLHAPVEALRSFLRTVLRGMRIKYELRRGGVSKCTDLMTHLYTQPRRKD